MFCPKCGTQSIAGDQRFCKSCGTNLQAVNDAVEKSANKPGLGKDPVGFGLHLVNNIVESVKESVGDVSINKDLHRSSRIADKMARRQEQMEEWKAKYAAHLDKREERRKQREQLKHMPDPDVLLTYSSEHSLRHGLMSFFGGLAFATFLFYFCRAALDAGAIQDIEELTHKHINVLEPLIRWLWLLAAIPVLKGLGQIIYAAFFAESIKTLAKRFNRQTEPIEGEEVHRRDTAPQSDTTPIQESLPGPPPSVTEGTTQFFEGAKATKKG
jgi:hypothetical protein